MAASKATERLAELEEAVREAERRRAEIDGERRKATRALSAAEGARLDLERRRAAGEAVDDEEFEDAVRAIAEAREDADERVWGARLEGAAEAIERAEFERDAFGREHFAEIAAEEAALDGPARDALLEAWSTLREAANAYAIRTRRWHHLARYGGLDAADIPTGTPVSGDLDDVTRRFAAGIPAPTPRPLR